MSEVSLTDETINRLATAIVAALRVGEAIPAQPIPAEMMARRDAGEIEIGRRMENAEPVEIFVTILDATRTRFDFDGMSLVSEVDADTFDGGDFATWRWNMDNEFLREHGVALIA